MGFDPYPYAYDVTHHAQDILDGFDGLVANETVVSVAGRMMARRSHGKSTFVHVQDKSGRIQVYFKLDILGEKNYELVKRLDLGDLIGVTGTLFETRTGEKTIQAKSITFLAKSLRPLPEKWHGLKDVEIRYRQRYLDLIVNEDTRKVFRARAAIVSAIRRFLDGRDFLEVDTPILQPIYGGAFATPFTTHHEALDMTLYLRISNELYLKRLIVGGMERVYEIARDFRNEGIDRSHNPEFSMLEFYQAYADYNEMMEVTEELVSEAIKAATGSYQTAFGGHSLDFTPPWDRVRYFDAIQKATGVDILGADDAALRALCDRLKIDLEGKVGRGQLVDAIFSETVEPNLIKPTFLTDFPREISPLAKKHRDDDRVVERFEVFVGGMELANAFSEQNDPAAQEAAFDDQAELRTAGDAEAQVKDHDYIRALETGMPPTGGVGIGIDRLVMLATGMENIREVILFPQLRHEDGLADTADAETDEEVMAEDA
ncbi:MAG: lysine--tRNA ligase [Candidatus Eisenbacteria bacterium]|uniref:Lysine--tRNA ligase n=1 Tax=Eiseniibacteriota bacterium TaxID=2212470 RepID=A0A7Y2H1I7_UNCEI|nr:lysine--tRNA ligase [Candidatus Eisenbacteria bacterium]